MFYVASEIFLTFLTFSICQSVSLRLIAGKILLVVRTLKYDLYLCQSCANYLALLVLRVLCKLLREHATHRMHTFVLQILGILIKVSSTQIFTLFLILPQHRFGIR